MSDAIDTGECGRWMLTLAERPADEEHAHGHSKAEYFSLAFEGLLILVSAFAIACTAIDRLMNPALPRRSGG
ncbi:MAG: cation transporter [Gallionella sp.]